MNHHTKPKPASERLRPLQCEKIPFKPLNKKRDTPLFCFRNGRRTHGMHYIPRNRRKEERTKHSKCHHHRLHLSGVGGIISANSAENLIESCRVTGGRRGKELVPCDDEVFHEVLKA
ncbi:hypothetical protein CEXT_574081 [Caerostris extrusa]|uniref:Uncharacterized protein n=1 Tax=Caerostris extrusa TaxID=172846 RepID=A0AAV4MZI2_CAEEX|nr:hypothetical protein CEXT_574081 [Caerostris extrusa]